MSEKSSTAEFLELLHRKDPEACARCVREHSDALYRLALRMMRDPQEAEDVVQETFLSAFNNIDSFQGRSSIGTWLFRIAYNASLMRLRRKQPDLISVEEEFEDEQQAYPRSVVDWSGLPEEEVLEHELRGKIEEAVQEMPATLRAVFVLREMEDLSTAQTGEVLDLSEEAVKTRLHRARLWLRERLSQYLIERRWAHQEVNHGS